jgi:hypothetical protein
VSWNTSTKKISATHEVLFQLNRKSRSTEKTAVFQGPITAAMRVCKENCFGENYVYPDWESSSQ